MPIFGHLNGAIGIIIVLAVIHFSSVAESKGLKCYECGYVEGEGFEGLDFNEPSCKVESKPDDKFAVDCIDYTDLDGEYEPSCATIVFTEVQIRNPKGHFVSANLTARSCAHLATSSNNCITKKEGCFPNTFKGLRKELVGPLSAILRTARRSIDKDGTGDLCICNSDNCNFEGKYRTNAASTNKKSPLPIPILAFITLLFLFSVQNHH